MKTTKGKRNKFFKCLEPLGAVDGSVKSKRSGVDGKETVDYSLGSGQGCGGGGGDFIPGFLKLSSSDSSNGGFANDNSRGSFSRVIKAVLFEKSLLRKFRKKGSSHPTFVQSTSSNSSPETDQKTTKLSKEKSLSKETWGGTDDQFLSGNSSDSSDTSLFSSSTTTSSATSSRSASERKVSPPRSVTFAEPKQSTLNEEASSSSREPLILKPSKLTAAVKEPVVMKQARPVTVTVTKRYNLNVIMCFIVVSLMALVFWGKALAIVCTSAWFYMVPRSFEWDSPEIDSHEIYMTKMVDERMSEEKNPSRRLS